MKHNIFHVNGFEEYKHVSLCSDLFDGINHSYKYNYTSIFPSIHMIYDSKYNLKQDSSSSYHYTYYNHLKFSKDPYQDHKELLKDGAKLYVHPSCKISRALTRGKYIKVLDPFLADCVALPSPSSEYVRIGTEAIFVNEEEKVVVVVTLADDTLSLFSSVKEGTMLGSLLTDDISCWNGISCSKHVISQAELVYCGSVVIIPTDKSYLVDVFNGLIPIDKTVYEETLQESLADGEQKLDLDSLKSIYNMLSSPDNEVVGTGLKALSVMGYSKCPNSVKFILNATYCNNWKYNKAFNSTPVKFMFKYLFGTNYKRKIRFRCEYEDKINKDDFQMFKELVACYADLDITQYHNGYNFMYYFEGTYLPRLKEEAA